MWYLIDCRDEDADDCIFADISPRIFEHEHEAKEYMDAIISEWDEDEDGEPLPDFYVREISPAVAVADYTRDDIHPDLVQDVKVEIREHELIQTSNGCEPYETGQAVYRRKHEPISDYWGENVEVYWDGEDWIVCGEDQTFEKWIEEYISLNYDPTNNTLGDFVFRIGDTGSEYDVFDYLSADQEETYFDYLKEKNGLLACECGELIDTFDCPFCVKQGKHMCADCFAEIDCDCETHQTI